MKFCSPGQMKAISLFSDMLRMLTNQPCAHIMQLNKKSKFKNSLNKFSFILPIVIWSQSASILTKTFTGLLLKTYFNRKTVPLVETFQDIYLNKEISIAASSYLFKSLKTRLKEPAELKSDILTRIIEFETIFKYSQFNSDAFTKFFFRKLIEGETVILLSSKIVRLFESHWKQEKKYFQVSGYKYSPNYLNYLVAKINPIARLLNAL